MYTVSFVCGGEYNRYLNGSNLKLYKEWAYDQNSNLFKQLDYLEDSWCGGEFMIANIRILSSLGILFHFYIKINSISEWCND